MQQNEPDKIVNTGIKLDESLHNRLISLGEIKERSPHWLMKAAISEYVEREEKRESMRLEDLQRWANYEATGHAIPMEDVIEWLESIGTDGELPCPE